MICLGLFCFVLKIVLLLERGEGREKERERASSVPEIHGSVASHTAHNPGICPDRVLNWRPFGLQAGTQSTEPHHPGLVLFFFRNPILVCKVGEKGVLDYF